MALSCCQEVPARCLGKHPPRSTVCEHFVNLSSLRDEWVFSFLPLYTWRTEVQKRLRSPMVLRWINLSELQVHPTRLSGSDCQEGCAGSLVTLKNQLPTRSFFFCFPFQFSRALKVACPPSAELDHQQCMARFPKGLSANYLNLCHRLVAVFGFFFTGPHWSPAWAPCVGLVKEQVWWAILP